MTTQTKALKLALEALLWANEEINGWMDDAYGLDPVDHPEIMSAITAIKEALAQPEQEPVACIEDGDLYFANEIDWQTLQKQGFAVQLLYTTPPQRTWVGLKEKEIDQGLVRTNYAMQIANAWRDGVAWAQLQLKEKNT